MSVDWVFDPTPVSGARKGGNAAEYGFEGTIDTLVRETIQNSMDARRPEVQQVAIRFRMIELSGEKMQSFLDAMAWDSLRDNLERVSRNGESIQRAIEEMYEKDRILLLCIEDRGTHGLTGSEKRENDSDTNRFSALVRDELYSDKDTPDAGGSFGLGKILLWAYSAYKTVLFSSIPSEYPPGKQGLRFIGRTSLPDHETEDDGHCAGPGWLGIKRQDEKYGELGSWAESVWGQQAGHLAAQCYSNRDAGDYGLSTVIVGFEEPGQETRPVEEIVLSIHQSAIESFWPALTRGLVHVTVTHENGDELIKSFPVIPTEDEQFGLLADLLTHNDENELEQKDKLQRVAEETLVEVPIEVPERIAGEANSPSAPHPAFTGKVKVLVKLLDEDREIDGIRDRIWRFRRPGMIVRSAAGGALSISARPYAAAVLCGRAAGETRENERVEHFLRAAEPPEHDKWRHDTRAIKTNYKTHGVKAKLDRFDNAIKVAIRDLVSLPENKGGALPKELLKHLRFGDSSGGGNPRFLTATTSARIENDRWTFNTKIRRTRVTPGEETPWTAIIKLKYAVDGGSPDDVKAISKVVCEKATHIEIRKGDAWLQFPPNVGQAKVSGITSSDALPAVGARSVIQINVDGEKGGFSDVE